MSLYEMVSTIEADWDAGKLNFGDAIERFVALVTTDSIDDLMLTVSPKWRTELIYAFESIVAADEDPNSFRIVAGAFAWEHEGDPAKRQKMRREYHRLLDEEDRQRKSVVVPAIGKWLAVNVPNR